MVGLLTFGVNAPAGSASSQPAHGTLVVRILPKSPVEVGNCIPFGNNVDYGFTGFIYRNVHPFTLKVGDRIAFDLGNLNDVAVKRNIYFAVANKNPDPAQVEGGNVVSQGVAATTWIHMVSDAQTPGGKPKGDTVVGDYELRYRAESAFSFPGGGLIVGVGATPPGQYADSGCDQVLVATGSEDASGQFYARFCFKDDQSLGVLDEAGACVGTASWIGGLIIRRL
jgi:hypothetical protein